MKAKHLLLLLVSLTCSLTLEAARVPAFAKKSKAAQHAPARIKPDGEWRWGKIEEIDENGQVIGDPYIFEYDNRGRISHVSYTSSYYGKERVEYQYSDSINGRNWTYYSRYVEDTDSWLQFQRHCTVVDSIAPHICLEDLKYYYDTECGEWHMDSWEYYKCILDRNEDGNVVMSTEFWDPDSPIFATEIIYDGDLPSEIKFLSYDFDLDDLVYQFSLGELEWESCNGQIGGIQDLFTNGNKLKKFTKIFSGVSVDTYTVKYSDDKGSYEISLAGKIGTSHQILDDNGSYIHLEFNDDYSSFKMFNQDRFGLTLADYEEVVSDGTREIYSNKSGSVTYHPEYGYPLTYREVQTYDDGTESQHLYRFSDYKRIDSTPTGIVTLGADPTAPVRYYDLQGHLLSTPPTARGLYIRQQGNKAEKIVL